MIRYLLGNTGVESPLGLDSLTLRKIRNPRYWGFLYRRLGYADGLGRIRFESPDAVRLLRSAFETKGLAAVLSFQMSLNGRILYDGFVDFGQYSFDGRAVGVAFRDDQIVARLESQATTAYSVEVNKSIHLHARRTGGLVSLLVATNDLTVQRSAKSAVPIAHTLPLSRKDEKQDTLSGDLLAITDPMASQPVYRNTGPTEKLLQISGRVACAARSSVGATMRLVIRALDAQGQPQNYLPAIEISRFTLSSTAAAIRTVVSAGIAVPAGCGVRIGWETDTQAQRWSFVYGTDTQLSATDEPGVPASAGYGILAGDLLSAIIARLSGGKLGFRSDMFTSGAGSGLMIATGAGVRGINSAVVVSMESLYTGLNNIYNLALWLEGDVVRIEARADAPQKRTIIRDIFSISQGPALAYIYNQVTTGYVTWQGDGVLAGLELNGSRQYTTPVTTVRNALDLRSSLIASSTLIEEQRRKQLSPKTASGSKGDSYDAQLFAICCVRTATGWVAETTQFSSSGEPVFDPETIYNRRIMPGRNLQRWADRLRGSLPLTLESVQGSARFSGDYQSVALSEDQPTTTGQAATPILSTLEVPMSLDDYEALGEQITVSTDTFSFTGELMEAQWKKTGRAETVTLTLLS